MLLQMQLHVANLKLFVFLPCNSSNLSCVTLVQLKHSYDGTMLYGEHYGYRSGLNPSMVTHLQQKVADICDNKYFKLFFGTTSKIQNLFLKEVGIKIIHKFPLLSD